LQAGTATVFSPELNKQLTALARKLNQAVRLKSDEAREAADRKLAEFAKTAGVAGATGDHLDADQVLGRPSCSLAVYGSLRPGQQNFHQVETVAGEWFSGTVEGELGAWRQYKRLIIDSGVRNQIPVDVLRSDQLPQHWDRLDQFEGPAYERILWPVTIASGVIVATLYVRPA
jgi:gamma-glutamylcyclotransferase (GGCT)/AIG2-like uncharacterized protein YtfP